MGKRQQSGRTLDGEQDTKVPSPIPELAISVHKVYWIVWSNLVEEDGTPASLDGLVRIPGRATLAGGEQDIQIFCLGFFSWQTIAAQFSCNYCPFNDYFTDFEGDPNTEFMMGKKAVGDKMEGTQRRIKDDKDNDLKLVKEGCLQRRYCQLYCQMRKGRK